MRPLDAPPTALGHSLVPREPTPRRAKPLTLHYSVENTGDADTGNLEIEFTFPPGQAPDAIGGSGWISYGTTLRKALLPAGAAETLALSWAKAPSVETLGPAIVLRSDTVADELLAAPIPLAPSLAEFTAGLAETGHDDDPDGDGISNLLEYALGADPASGRTQLPELETAAGLAMLRFSERQDKEARGLEYRIEFSTDLSAWSESGPPGLDTGVAVRTAAPEGFRQRIVSWPVTATPRFARLRVELNE